MTGQLVCPLCGRVEIRGVYDGTCYWLCAGESVPACMRAEVHQRAVTLGPGCDVWWHSFPVGDRRREAVARAMTGRPGEVTS